MLGDASQRLPRLNDNCQCSSWSGFRRLLWRIDVAIDELTGAGGKVPADSGAAHEARSRRVAISEAKRSPRQLLICISQLVIQVVRRVAPAVVTPKPVRGEPHRHSAPSLRTHNFRRGRCRIGDKGHRKGPGALANRGPRLRAFDDGLPYASKITRRRRWIFGVGMP